MKELLNFTNEIWDNPSLEGVVVIAAQHLMESTFHLLKNLQNQGLDPSQTFLLGKCYSSSPTICSKMQAEGFYVSPLSFAFDSHEPYDELYKKNIESFAVDALKNIHWEKAEKIIVVDDGGYLAHYIASLNISNVPVIGVEQTSAGIHYLNKQSLEIAVINVGRSRAKLLLETPFIVESALERLYRYIPQELLCSKQVLVLGRGAIGQKVAKVLEDQCSVSTYDPMMNSQEDFAALVSQADVLLGCSGATSLKSSDYALLKKGAILASFSSSDREFDAHVFRKNFPKTSRCLSIFSNENAHLLQSGFPLNFWGSKNNMDLSKIQITMALLTSAVYQALSLQTAETGPIALNPKQENLIIDQFQKTMEQSLVLSS